MSQMNPVTEPTGVYNKYVFNVLMQHEISRTRRYPTPITLIHIALVQKDMPPENLDKAKTVVAYILNRFLRGADVPAQDGDSFFVLLPQTDLDGGKIVAARLLTRLDDPQIGADGLPFKPNACIGLTWHPGGDSLTTERLFQEAGQAVQTALRQGPKSLVIYSEMQESIPPIVSSQ